MIRVPMKEARTKLNALARRVENGERFVVTRYGEPMFDMVPHVPPEGGSDQKTR